MCRIYGHIKNVHTSVSPGLLKSFTCGSSCYCRLLKQAIMVIITPFACDSILRESGAGVRASVKHGSLLGSFNQTPRKQRRSHKRGLTESVKHTHPNGCFQRRYCEQNYFSQDSFTSRTRDKRLWIDGNSPSHPSISSSSLSRPLLSFFPVPTELSANSRRLLPHQRRQKTLSQTCCPRK